MFIACLALSFKTFLCVSVLFTEWLPFLWIFFLQQLFEKQVCGSEARQQSQQSLQGVLQFGFQ